MVTLDTLSDNAIDVGVATTLIILVLAFLQLINTCSSAVAGTAAAQLDSLPMASTSARSEPTPSMPWES